jgi:gas vesicle protein
MMGLMRFLTGFVVGTSIGAAVGLLFAPQSGDQTVGVIRGRVQGILEEGRQAAAQTRADAYARLSDLKEGDA